MMQHTQLPGNIPNERFSWVPGESLVKPSLFANEPISLIYTCKMMRDLALLVVIFRKSLKTLIEKSEGLLISIYYQPNHRLLKIHRQPTTGFAFLGAHQVGSRQMNVLHQNAPCFSRYEIRDIAIHAAENSSTAHDRFRPSWGVEREIQLGSSPMCPARYQPDSSKTGILCCLLLASAKVRTIASGGYTKQLHTLHSHSCMNWAHRQTHNGLRTHLNE
ncbi:hypothetical protein T265_08840 [Opisthorchis viverrini]|uniref:Uncharacterized protein n=1 Tax=Opisthorchis viverrini TaxID=6198 RepID=A0A074ZCB6_OPIVI|nr:hypothetical protein T265_08840 [Opisthorchis viverrini]KER23227.1 hypothetical protein T265_08840 [Opisthorchis viverrini]